MGYLRVMRANAAGGRAGGIPGIGVIAKSAGKVFARSKGVLGKISPKLLPAIPGVGTVATVVGAAASVYGAKAAIGSITGGARKKYRKMNPANGKAINRAIRRIDAAEKMFKKVLRVRSPEKARGSIVPKKGKR